MAGLQATPTLSYVICATPRTGSYLLCEGLRNTGVAGKPTEYFSSSYERYWRPRWGAKTYAAYLRQVARVGAGDNGVFGVKVHPIQFTYFAHRAAGAARVGPQQRKQLVERWFPGARYVWVKRIDKLRQGISYAKALQTRVWWDADQAPAPYDAPRPHALRFDQRLIERAVAQMHTEEDSWREYFDVNAIQPLVLNYEDLVADVLGAVRRVVDHLGLELADDLELPPSQFRRQADDTTENWVARLRQAISAEPALALTERADHDTSRATSQARQLAARPNRTADLNAVLANRRWWRCQTPFPHLRAEDVFVPDVYQRMAEELQSRLANDGFSRELPGYDATSLTITDANAGPFSLFLSRAWHDMLANLFGVQATGDVDVSLHHHARGSLSGSPHNDLNPGWFATGRSVDGITVNDPKRWNYRHGRGLTGDQGVERIRAVAVLYYLAGADGHVGGGETGLYRSASDPVDRPLVAVAPRNNSLVAFECTPFSFHSFITNPHAERNCLVMWLHRRKEEAVRRWGEQSIVYW